MCFIIRVFLLLIPIYLFQLSGFDRFCYADDSLSRGRSIQKNIYPYQDASLPIQLRVKDLLARMTLEEKCAQLISLSEFRLQLRQNIRLFNDADHLSTEFKQLLKNGLGEFSRPAGNLLRLDRPKERYQPLQVARFTNQLQKYIIENTRLGIPVIFHEEALHGLMAHDATVFPQAIALASTWNPQLVHEVFTTIAKEARARGAQHVLTPVLDIALDPRWGRTEETYGEDPYLVSQMGLACITGFQGKSPFIDSEHVAATAKHFGVHGHPEGGLNTSPTNYSERMIRENHFYPFRIAVQKAGVKSVMAAYSEIDGIPCHINHWLLKDVLRKEWNFNSIVVSDYDAIPILANTYHVAEDNDHAAKLAIEAGIDMELPSILCYSSLVDQVKNGLIAEKTINKSVERVLSLKFSLGMFEHPFVNLDWAEKINNNPVHAKLALQAALESVVLLKNENNILPLDKSISSLAVIGPNAKDCVLGGYSGIPKTKIGILQGIQQKVNTNVQYAKGCALTIENPDGTFGLGDKEGDLKEIDKAVKVASKADAVVVVVGGNEHTTAEGGDRSSLDLLGRQTDLVKAIVETGVPVVVVLINGRPLSINYIAENVAGILECWYLGQETGRAIADILFGDYNPGGKLPITFPRSVGHLPAYYYKKPVREYNKKYLFVENGPLFPFGHGLSYTRFELDQIRVYPDTIGQNGNAKISVNITNIGPLAGDQVVQLYIRDSYASVTRPVKKLMGFERIHLDPLETKRVEFSITPENLSFLDRHMERIVQPGVFDLMIGTSSVPEYIVQLYVREMLN